MTFTRSRFVALTLATLLAAGGAAAQVFGLTIEGPERVFTVQMPNKPEYKISALKSPAGTAFNLHSYLLTNGPIDYVAQTETYPADIDVSRPQAVLQAALDATAPYLAGGKWDKIAWRQVQGMPAADASGTFKDGRIFRPGRAQGPPILFARFPRPAGRGQITDADRFFTSLKVTP